MSRKVCVSSSKITDLRDQPIRSEVRIFGNFVWGSTPIKRTPLKDRKTAGQSWQFCAAYADYGS
ncbi:MAG: hypothetical protein ABN482_05765, partial [Corticimicrobacter sp.]|uniref:hypothetical protein n=1 Tax=Corticimicrobacter sp. TaxID=2678536 RepID=UPI0032DBAF3B